MNTHAHAASSWPRDSLLLVLIWHGYNLAQDNFSGFNICNWYCYILINYHTLKNACVHCHIFKIEQVHNNNNNNISQSPRHLSLSLLQVF